MINFNGKYRARVADVEDPEYRGRIRVTCSLVYGENEDSGELNRSPWCLPCFPYGGSLDKGFCAVPEIHSAVWIEFEQGDPDRPIWVGCWIMNPDEFGSMAPGEFNRNEGTGARFGFNNSDGVDDQDDGTVPPFGTSNPNKRNPQNKVWRSASGHTIELDDTDGQLKVKITDSAGQYILFRPEGGQGGGPHITMKGAWGQYIYIDGKDGQKKIQLKDAAGNIITMDAEDGSIHMEDQRGDFINIHNGLMELFAFNDIHVHTLSSKVLIEASQGEIQLNSQGGIVNILSKEGGKITVEGTNVDVKASGVTHIQGGAVMIEGSSSLHLQGGGPAIARVGDKVSCGATITEGSPTAGCG